MNIKEISSWFEKENRVLPLAADLVRLSSENPPGKEREVACYIAEWLENLGLKVEFMEVENGRPNVLAYYGQGEPGILLNGHMDVVPVSGDWTVPPYQGIVKDGRLYGRGSADMKGGIAAMMAAAEFMVKNCRFLKKSLLLAFVSDEESRNKGMRALLKMNIKADAAIIGEPTGLKVQTGHRGFVGMKITCRGKSCHSSNPEGGVNAIYKMAEVIKRLEKHADDLKYKTEKYLGKASLSVGTVQGGKNVNTVPDKCILGLERRILPGENGAGVAEEIQSIIEDLGEVEVLSELPACKSEPDHPLVLQLSRIIEELTNKPAPVSHFPAGCEASLITEGLGIPAVIFGPGNLERAHKVDEWVDVKELTEAAKVYAAICCQRLI